MTNNSFAIEQMAKGSFVDTGVGDGHLYLVEAYTIRLNHIALEKWYESEIINCRDCYHTDEEWEEHKVRQEMRREVWKKMIIESLGIDPDIGGVTITQNQSEVFTVVHIREV